MKRSLKHPFSSIKHCSKELVLQSQVIKQLLSY